jgi:hypothetical protein
MSIINEALKKTEEHLQKNAAKEDSLPPKPIKPKSFLLYILILLAGLFLGNSIFELLRYKIQAAAQLPQKESSSIQPPVNSPLSPALPVEPPQKSKPETPSFILNGIFFSDNDGYALINNQIVRENDYVAGAKVGLITTNIVELDNAGQTITLSTNR